MRTKAVEAAVSVNHAPDPLDGVVDAPGEAIESGKVKTRSVLCVGRHSGSRSRPAKHRTKKTRGAEPPLGL